jgi:putative phosphoesterase
MRLGILSDTHDRLGRTLTAVEQLLAAGADALVHCGDLTGPDIVRACAQRPFWFVLGNNDDDWPALRRAVAEVDATCLEWGGEIELAGKRIAVSHGHLTREIRPLKAAKPDYFLSGHSHIAEDRREGTIRCINPGALHRAVRFSVALLDLESDELHFLEVER